MGNVLSRCVQNVRNTLLTCSRKQNEDEPMLTSTCDSEVHDKYNGPCLDPSASLIDRSSGDGVVVTHGGSQSSLVNQCDRVERSEYFLKSSTPKSHLGQGSKGYRTLPSCDDDEIGPGRVLVDRGIQTAGAGDDPSSPEPQVLSKEFIIKTYSIKNATPSPTIQAKFLPKNLSCALEVHDPPSPSSDDASPPSNNNGNGPSLSSQYHHRRFQYVQSSGVSNLEATPNSTFTTPLANVLHRQEQVLSSLEDLQSSVTQMAKKYNVSASTSSSAMTPSKSLGNTSQEIVINVDPSSIPLSLILLCEQLSKQYSVFKSTYVHSSVTGQVPDNLLHLMTSNGGTSRANSQISVVLVWKKVVNGPQLVVDPTRQTPICGEANIIRYLARLLQPAYDDIDAVTATQTDDFLDLAQLQLIEGSSKEKANAVRSLNSSLGKKTWLVGEEPGIADYFCWSALNQAGLTEGSPTNVKRWLGSCNSHASFKSAVSIVC